VGRCRRSEPIWSDFHPFWPFKAAFWWLILWFGGSLGAKYFFPCLFHCSRDPKVHFLCLFVVARLLFFWVFAFSCFSVPSKVVLGTVGAWLGLAPLGAPGNQKYCDPWPFPMTH